MRTRWAGGLEIGRNFEPHLNRLTFEPPAGYGVGESQPIVAQVLGRVAEFLQSCGKRVLAKDGHVRKLASARSVC